MLKTKAFFTLIIFLLTSTVLSPSYADIRQLNELSDHGKNTCVFSNAGLEPRGRGQILTPMEKFCHATVLSKKHILISDSSCWEKKFQTSQQKHVSCHGARQVHELFNSASVKKLASGQQIVQLSSALPYTPHKLAKDQAQRSDWLLRQQSSCKVETPYRTAPLTQFRVQQSDSSSPMLVTKSEDEILKYGGHITCQNDRGEFFILGQINKDGKLWPSLKETWPNDFFNNIDPEPYRELSRLEKTRLLCRESDHCLKNIGSQTKELTEDIIASIHKLTEDYQNQDLKQSHDELHSEFQKLLLQCHEVAWEIKRSEDDSAPTSIFSKVRGSIESLSLKAAERWHDGFLVDQFMKVDLVSNKLSRSRVRSIVEEQTEKAKSKNLNQIQRVAQTALEISKQTVLKMLLEMNPMLSEDEQKLLWQKFSQDYQKCLKKADNIAMIQDCSDKFSLTAPTLVAQAELERQLEINFKSRNSENNYEELKSEAKLSYRKCLQDYYYPESDNRLIGHADRVRACVYEGMLSGYKATAKAQISKGLSKVTDDPQVIESAQLSSLEEAQECEYGITFHRQEQRTQQDYETLARLDASDFKIALENCSKDLTRLAGEKVVRESILRTPEVIKNLDPYQRGDLSERVLNEYYTPCLEAQKRPDPNQCEKMIRDLTTLQVAIPLMIEAVDEQMSQLINDSPENGLQTANDIKNEVDQSMQACHDDLKNQHLKNLQEQTQVSKFNALECLEQGIRLVAKGSAKQVIKDGIRYNPQTRDFADEILALDEVQNLPDFTADCFGERVQKLDEAKNLGPLLPEISKDCALETQKKATILSLRPIIDKKLSSNLPNEYKRKDFIDSILEENQGLKSQIESAQSQQQLNEILEQIPNMVALRFAKKSVPELIQRYLSEITSVQKQQNISNAITTTFENCLKDSGATQEELDICINRTTILGHEKVFAEIVEKTALENLQNDTELSSRLVKDSQKRLKHCLDNIPETLQPDEFNRQLEPCITHEIGLISRDIPREAILSVAPLMKTQYSKQDLRDQMNSIDQFYLSEGGLDNVDDHDPALQAYMSLNTCIISARSQIRQNEMNVDRAQTKYKECATEVKDTIKSAIKRGFVHSDYEGQNSSHSEPLNQAADILIELAEGPPGKTKAENSSASSDPHTKNLELLDLVGQNTVIACNYAPQRCEKELIYAQADLMLYKRKKPNATQEELQDWFINSSFMKLVIEANLAKTLREELSASLSQFQDERGILDSQIRKITSPEIMSDIMSNRYGQAVSEVITKAIKRGDIENASAHPATRSALGLALVENTSHNSFTDRLLFGLVQPQLNRQRKESSHIGGLFNNSKVTLGRLFGVVRGKDFDWNRIRLTPHGQRAREIFAKDILLPVVQGKDLSRRVANDSQKSLQDVHLERIQKLIEQGIKNLSQ